MANKLTALVTGSARRLGMAIAKDLTRTGFSVVLHSRSADAAKLAAREIGDGVIGITTADLSVKGGPEKALGDTLRYTAGHLSLLVNNAASFTHRPPSRTTMDDWDLEMNLGARGPFFASIRAFDVLKATGGMVINISDYGAIDHWPNYAAHAISKAALESQTMVLAKAWEGEVNVNAICPPTVRLPEDIIGADPLGGKENRAMAQDPRGSVPASAVTSTLLELYMQKATGQIKRLGDSS